MNWTTICCCIFRGAFTLLPRITLSYDVMLLANNPVTITLFALHLFHSVNDRCRRQCGLIVQSALNVDAMLDAIDASSDSLIFSLLAENLFLLRV